MTTICMTQAPAPSHQCHYSCSGWCPQYGSSIYSTHAASPVTTSRVSHITVPQQGPSVTVSAYVCPAESVHTQSTGHMEGITSQSVRQVIGSSRPAWTTATG